VINQVDHSFGLLFCFSLGGMQNQVSFSFSVPLDEVCTLCCFKRPAALLVGQSLG